MRVTNHLRLAALLLLLAPLARAANVANFTTTVITNTGRPVAGAKVTICAHVITGPNPCVVPVAIFSDYEETHSIPNPTVADGYGNVFVFLAAGVYDYSVAGTGILTQTFRGATLNSNVSTGITGAISNNQVAVGGPSNTIVGVPSLTFVAATGNLSVASLDGVLIVDGVKFPTIQSAISALPASGGVVFVPPGVFDITSIAPLTIPTGTQRSIRLVGANATRGSTFSGSTCVTKITNNSVSADWVDMIATAGTGQAQVSIENLCFDGTSSGVPIFMSSAGANSSVSQIYIRGNWIKGGTNGIKATQSAGATFFHIFIEDNLIWNQLGDCVFLNGSPGLTTQVEFKSNWILRCGLNVVNTVNVSNMSFIGVNQFSDSTNGDGIHATGADATTIVGNDFENLSRAGSFAINISGNAIDIIGNKGFSTVGAVTLNPCISCFVGANQWLKGTNGAGSNAVVISGGSSNNVGFKQNTDWTNSYTDSGTSDTLMDVVWDFGQPVRIGAGSYLNVLPVLVGALPVAGAGNAGQIRTVSDSTAVASEGQTCVGGGAVTAAAFSNGVVWKCF
jgi:hypothetical protein